MHSCIRSTLLRIARLYPAIHPRVIYWPGRPLAGYATRQAMQRYKSTFSLFLSEESEFSAINDLHFVTSAVVIIHEMRDALRLNL